MAHKLEKGIALLLFSFGSNEEENKRKHVLNSTFLSNQFSEAAK